MKFRFMHIKRRLACIALLGGLVLTAGAQPAGMLYDPEPPSDSAYVRVVHASRDGAVDIAVDGQVRVKSLKTGEASDYLVLGAGKRAITVNQAGQKKPLLSTSIDVVSGQPMTVGLTSMRSDSTPVVFIDKANTNKLKALLTVYHLDDKFGKLDVVTADGSTKVFSGVSSGTSATIPVNPISISLMALKAGELASKVTASLSMTQGGNYSLLLLAVDGKGNILRSVQNKTERYTGK